MVSFIVKYWLEVLFGAIAAGLGFACKWIWKLYQQEKNHQKTEEQKSFYEGLQDLIVKNTEAQTNAVQGVQTQLDTLREGLLNLQGKIFKDQCRIYLNENYKVSLQEFETLQEDHDVYKSLGGNHDGDSLFELVTEKVKNDLTD